MLTQWLMHFDNYLPTLSINRLFMAIILQHLKTIIPDKRIDKQVQILLFSVNFEEIQHEFDPHKISIRYGYPGAVWLLSQALVALPNSSQFYQPIKKTYENLILKFGNSFELLLEVSTNCTEDKEQYGVTNGWVGVGLLELLYPGSITR